MQDIRLYKNKKRFGTMFLVLVYIPFFLFLPGIADDSAVKDTYGLSVQQLSNCKNVSYMAAFHELLYGFLFPLSSNFISIAGHFPVFDFDRHVIVPHSTHAPPSAVA